MKRLHIAIRLRRGAEFLLELQCQIAARAVTAVYGPSGCGKTSLLHALAGLLRCEPGSEIRFGDDCWLSARRSLPTEARRIGLVFQEGHLFPHLDVDGNLEFAAKRAHKPGGPGKGEVIEWLGLAALLKRLPVQLSRGQQQRVAIARALLSHPDFLFLDEPLANLDRAGRREILLRLQALRAATDMPMLYVSHDMEEIAQLAGHMLVLDRGRLVASGAVGELSARLDLPMAQEERAAAVLAARVHSHEPEFGLTRLDVSGGAVWVGLSQAPPGGELRLRVPARDVSVCRTPPGDSSMLNLLPVRIAELEETRQQRQLVRLKTGDQYLLARLTRKSVVKLGLRAGERVYAQIKSVALLDG